MMNVPTYITSVLVFLVSTIVFSQDKLLDKANEEFDQYAFVDARKIYLDVVENGYKSADIFRKLGDSYYFNGELEKSVIWYEKLIKSYQNEVSAEYLFRYSQSLKSVKRYSESDEMMGRFNSLRVDDHRGELFMKTIDYLNFIDKQSGKFSLFNLDINSEHSDYAPSFNHADELVFASSRGDRGMSRTVHEWNKMPFLDLFESAIDVEKDKLGAPKRLKGKINSRFHESTTTFSKDGTTMYFTRNNYSDKKLKTDSKGTTLLKLYSAKLKDGKWQDIRELPFNSDEYSIAHPTLSDDGKTLYFASDMPGGKGMSDLYEIAVHDDGTFGTPKSLGDVINTEGRETFPFITASGMLFFASDGHVGLGGLDVFVAVPNKDGLSIPFNIGKPINSPEDDFSFILNEETEKGYFASNRKGGVGHDDIYGFIQNESLITNCKQYLTGVVTDKDTDDLLIGTEVILKDMYNNELGRTITDARGIYTFRVDCQTLYVVRAIKPNYSHNELVLATTQILEKELDYPLQLRDDGLMIKKVAVGVELSNVLGLETIYFDKNKADIRPDAEVELQKIIATLKRYSMLNIDVRSHTDSRAKDSYNLYLSKLRARATIKYIVEKGKIERSRVTGRGYGETKLINNCRNGVDCSDEEHQMNRRSEFIVRKKS